MKDMCARKYLISFYSLLSNITLNYVHIPTVIYGSRILSSPRLWEEFKNMEQSVGKEVIKLRRIRLVALVVHLEENLKGRDHLEELDTK
jgi:hypothetical protein